ncbi:MAG: C25 family cysteine peptidase [Planctomycetes bacterium]|nr:C25 family cysteine peptidase [Planctomycetota bacterium]
MSLIFAASQLSFANDLLIVAPSELKESAKAFADYRQNQGFSAKLFLSDEWFVEGDEDATRQRIKDRIVECYRDLYQWENLYVLLLGDVRKSDEPPTAMHVPTWYVDTVQKQPVARRSRNQTADQVPVHGYFPEWLCSEAEVRTTAQGFEIVAKVSVATDNPYACANGDDNVPEVCIGRITAKTNDEAKSVLEKIKHYEAGSDDAGYQRRLNFFASEGGFGPAIDGILERLFTQMADEYVPYDYDLSMTYANPTSPYVYRPDRFGEQVINRINEGSLFLTYIGHGSPDRLDSIEAAGRSYPILNLSACSEVNVLQTTGSPIFTVVACYTGMFDEPTGRDSIAETLSLDADGPVAVFASSRISHPYTNALIVKELMNSSLVALKPTLGEVFRSVKIDLATNNDQYRRMLDMMSMLFVPASDKADLQESHLAMYNLFGDPATKVNYPQKDIELAYNLLENGKLFVSCETEANLSEAKVTFETERSKIYHELDQCNPQNPSDWETVQTNYERANNKVVTSAEATFEDGWFELEFDIPRNLPRGKYAIKVFAQSDGAAHTASAVFSFPLRPSAPTRRAPRPAPATAPETDGEF